MSEHPYWSVLELRETANGWMVMRGGGMHRDVTGPQDVYVFNDWDECQRFMGLATNPKRRADNESASLSEGKP